MSDAREMSLERLAHMVDAADAIAAYVLRGRAAFEADPAVQDATLFRIVVMDRLVRHSVVDKSGKVIDDHFRPMYKPRVDDVPKE
jgi:uncharacterized protein with HEPN domain